MRGGARIEIGNSTISGGQLTDFGEVEAWLENAVNLCKANNVLIVAAAGNDGCDCLHVPAALPTVLAVGAMDAQGKPLDFSNWGEAYQSQGLLAPGENILGRNQTARQRVSAVLALRPRLFLALRRYC